MHAEHNRTMFECFLCETKDEPIGPLRGRRTTNNEAVIGRSSFVCPWLSLVWISEEKPYDPTC